MPDGKWYLVCYDVRNEKRLRRAAKKLEGRGQRLQYSVFRCWLTPADLHQLRWELTELLKPEDDVMFIPLCETCVGGISMTHSAHNQADWQRSPASHRIV